MSHVILKAGVMMLILIYMIMNTVKPKMIQSNRRMAKASDISSDLITLSELIYSHILLPFYKL